MHYKNGREAHNGDKVVLIGYNNNVVVGILYDAQAGNDYCNGRIAELHVSDPMPNLKECLHLDDVLEAYKNVSQFSDPKPQVVDMELDKKE